MSAVVVVGAQWGDEGKGKLVDLFAARADAVVRYAGGPNAGHTLVVGDDKLVLRLVPSGALNPSTECLLGSGMVVNPAALLEELDELAGRSIALDGRLHLSERAHLILPYHLAIDALREASSKGTTIGTTKRGIGPCYEDKIGRRGVRAGDLRDREALLAHIGEALMSWQPVATALGGELPTPEVVHAELAALTPRLQPLLADTGATIEALLDAGKRVLFEGAQGTLLDIDHGSYPYVTSSSASAGGACTGAGIGPTRIDRVIGVSKAYTTRVGRGPFPTELDDAAGAHLRDVGREYGSVTGRPRRTGWLDVAALRYARRVNGLGALAVTKLDVLSGLDPVRMCVGYRTPAGETDTLPAGGLDGAVPIYRALEGWQGDLSSCRRLDALPAAARRYLDQLSELTGLPLAAVSVGPRRDETIVLQEAFD